MPPARSPGRRLWLPALAAAACAALVIGFSPAAFATTLFGDDFEDGDTTGWSKSGGAWAVGADGSKVLTQSKADSDLSREFAGATSWTDYAVQARVKPLAFDSATPHFVALAARSGGSTSFDRLVLLPENRVELQAVRSGAVTVLASATLTVSTGAWYTLRLEASGTTVRGLVDGVLIGSGTANATTGRIGLQTSHATASFDDVTVDTLGGTPSPSASASPSVSPSPSRSAGPSPSPSPSPSPGTDADIVVAVNGSDTNPGTLAQPYKTIQKAVDVALPGDVIAVRGGTYAPTTNIRILHSGASGQPITLTAYGAERVIVDGEGMPYTPGAVGSSIPRIERGAIHLNASWWVLRGLELINGPYGLFSLDSNNNVLDRLTTRDNYESGLQIQGASSNNLVLNLDSYGNRDPRKNGESADGLAIKEGSGTGNIVRGARLWNNVDDGLDFWLFLSPIRVENSVAWGNGVNRWNFPDFAGDGNGFKLGGGDPDPPAGHVVVNSIAFGNAHGGFIDNGNPGTLTLQRNTAYRNGGNGFDFADSDSTLTGNLSVLNAAAYALGSLSSGSGNSWDIGGTWNDASLSSVSSSVITGPRQPNGAISSSNFLRPTAYPSLGAVI